MNDRRLIQRMSLFAYAYARMKSGGFQYIHIQYPREHHLGEWDADVMCFDRSSGISCGFDPCMIHSVFVIGTSNAMRLLLVELGDVLSRGGSVYAVWNEQGKIPRQLRFQDVLTMKSWRGGHRVMDFDYVIAEFKLGAANE